MVLSELARSLELYFARTAFQLRRERDVSVLRAAMENVYLRRRPLVLIDVEAYERDPTRVTEIGVAVAEAGALTPVVRTVHILIKENIDLKNGRYVPNRKHLCNTGVLYVMSQGQARSFLRLLFGHYFDKNGAVLVGHDVGGDTTWLKKMGVDIGTPNTVDLKQLYGMLVNGGGSLRGVLRLMHIPHANLHNAANDAYYTLLAVIALCDPAQRDLLHLDSYREGPQLTKREKRREKFLDELTVKLEVPTWFSMFL